MAECEQLSLDCKKACSQFGKAAAPDRQTFLHDPPAFLRQTLSPRSSKAAVQGGRLLSTSICSFSIKMVSLRIQLLLRTVRSNSSELPTRLKSGCVLVITHYSGFGRVSFRFAISLCPSCRQKRHCRAVGVRASRPHCGQQFSAISLDGLSYPFSGPEHEYLKSATCQVQHLRMWCRLNPFRFCKGGTIFFPLGL